MRKVENELPLLTIFTPAYNRAHTLTRTYDSLKKQNRFDFIWLIIDDGSTDNTASLVQGWKQEKNGFQIEYIYKENGGMHTAHNVAYENIQTELNVCIDSDDILALNAIDKIYSIWGKITDKNCAGIVGLDADMSGKIIGNEFESEGMKTTLSGFYQRGGKGDKKLVYRTDIMKRYPPYPVFGDEKLVPLSYKYILCDQDYYLVATNTVLCNVEYQDDGSTNNMWKQRVRNAEGFAFYKKICMQYPYSRKGLIKNTIMYIAFNRLGKAKGYLKNSPERVLTILLFPCGWVFEKIIRKKSHLF